MTISKRLFDIALALIGIVFLFPVGLAVALAIRLRDGAPVFFVSERMKSPTIPFL